VAGLHYMDHEGHKVTRAQFEENLALKMEDPDFLADISPLLVAEHTWEPKDAARIISSGFIALLPGEPWKGQVKI